MRNLLTSYPFIIFLAVLVTLFYPSFDPIVEELLATANITLDFSHPTATGSSAADPTPATPEATATSMTVNPTQPPTTIGQSGPAPPAPTSSPPGTIPP